MPRLPQPGADTDTWGQILNDFLAVAHASDGALKADSVGSAQIANSAVTLNKLANDAVTAFAPNTYVNVRSFGATGDGSTNDTAAIQSAATSVANNHGVLYFPHGTYNISATITIGSNTVIWGEGRYGTVIKKVTGGFAAINISGTGDNNHASHSGIREITIHGNAQSGALVQAYHANTLSFINCSFDFSNDVAIDTVDFRDSVFRGCSFSNNFSTSRPVVHLRSSGAASGIASSAGATNSIWFQQCTFETFWNGAVKIERGDSTGSNANGFWFQQCKFETSEVGGDILQISAAVSDVSFAQIFIAATGFKSGYSTAINGITSAAYGIAAYRDIRFTTGGNTTTGNAALRVSSSTGNVAIDNIYFDGPAVTSTIIFGSSGAAFSIGTLGSSGGSPQITGDNSGYSTANFSRTSSITGEFGQLNANGQMNFRNGAYFGGGAAVTIENDTNFQFATGNGTRLGTDASQKLSFYGATPTTRPTGTPAAASDAATTMALANDLRAKLITLGLIS